MIVDSAQLLLELLRRKSCGSQHAHSAGVGHLYNDVSAVRKGEDRSCNPEHLCDFGPHQILPSRTILSRLAAGRCLTIYPSPNGTTNAKRMRSAPRRFV